MSFWWGVDAAWLLAVAALAVALAAWSTLREGLPRLAPGAGVAARIVAARALQRGHCLAQRTWLLGLVLVAGLFRYGGATAPAAVAGCLGVLLALALVVHCMLAGCGAARRAAVDFTAAAALSLAALVACLHARGLLELVLLLELQGALFIYFMVAGAGVTPARRGADYAWLFGALLAQFWAAFAGALALLYGSVVVGYAVGSTLWGDLDAWHTFTAASAQAHWSGAAAAALLCALLGLLLKVGAAPLHLWKPELYRALSWELILWYGALYTFVIFSLVTLILQEYLGGWRLRWALWALACGGFILLANVLFVVGELRAFLAYMAVFHAAFILVGSHRVESSLTYALLYALMNVHFVGAMLALRRPRPQFLADLQGVSALSGVGGSLVCAIAAMSGIPPLAGFWAKAAVVAALAARGDYVLASLALACGLVLMYYYMQNYRFSAAARRGAVLVWSGSAAAAAAGLVGNLMLPALLNDVWTLFACAQARGAALVW